LIPILITTMVTGKALNMAHCLREEAGALT
jgi:hypothetical protein